MTYPARTTDPGTTAPARRRFWFQYLALVIGIVFLLVGLAGFAVTGFDGFTAQDQSQTLLGFAINPAHNIVHVVIGVLGLLLWRTVRGSRVFGWILFIGYGAAFVYGLLVDKSSDANFLNLNDADDVLHIVSALLGLVIALWPARDRAVVPARR